MFTIEKTQFKAALCAVGRCPPVLFLLLLLNIIILTKMFAWQIQMIHPLIHRNQPHSTHIPIIA